MEKQTNNPKQLLLVSALHGFSASVVDVLLGLYIWRIADFRTLVFFKIAEVLTVPLASIAFGWIGNRFGSKKSLLLGLMLFAFQLGLVLALQEQLVAWLIAIALLAGVSNTGRYMSLNVLYRSAIAPKLQPAFYGTMNVLFNTLRILFPIFSGVVIWFFGYSVLFLIAALAVVGCAIALSLVKSTRHEDNFEPYKIFDHWSERTTAISLHRLWWGIEYGFFLTLVPVLLTTQLGGELGWGLITALLSFLGIVAALYIRRNVKENARFQLMKFAGIFLSVGALMYSAIPVLDYLLLFLITLQLWQVLQSIVNRPAINAMIRSQPDAESMVHEYTYFLELPFSLGKLIILGTLWLISPVLHEPVTLSLLLLLISMIPIGSARSILSTKQKFLST